MKSIRLLAIVLLTTLLMTYTTSLADSDQFKIDKGPRRIGFTIIGGNYQPSLNWTIDKSYDYEDDESGSLVTKQSRFEEKLTGPGVTVSQTGFGLVYRQSNIGLRLSFVKSKTASMEYDKHEITRFILSADEGQTVEVAYPHNELPTPQFDFVSKHLTLAVMRYMGLYEQSVNLYLGGSFGITMMDYKEYVDSLYSNQSGWGYEVAPIFGLEFRPTPKIGISGEVQYMIGSTFSEDFSYVGPDIYSVVRPSGVPDDPLEGDHQQSGDYHLNTNGLKLQASLYYYLFD